MSSYVGTLRSPLQIVRGESARALCSQTGAGLCEEPVEGVCGAWAESLRTREGKHDAAYYAAVVGLALCDFMRIVTPGPVPVASVRGARGALWRIAAASGLAIMVGLDTLAPLTIEHSVAAEPFCLHVIRGKARCRVGNGAARPVPGGGLRVGRPAASFTLFLEPDAQIVYMEHPITVWLRQER